VTQGEPAGHGNQLSFWEHLTELRQRLLYIVIALFGGFIVAWIFKEQLFAIVSAPVKEGLAAHGIYRLTAIETTEAVMVYLKLAMAAAIVVTIPVSLWQLWMFVKPGLVATETRPMRRIAILAVFMFVLGLLFCYRFVLPLVIDFLTGFTLGAGGVDFQVTMKSTYSTTFIFLVGFGVIFELPLVMVLLAATPLFDSSKYLKWIRYSVVIAFVIGSMLTPPDVLSQCLMAVPITILYVVGIGMTYLSERRRASGKVAATGMDWQLAGSVLFLASLIALLVMPASRPMASYLPSGARAILLSDGDGTSFKCGGLVTPDLGSKAAERVCAVYSEGTVLLATPQDGVAADSLCPPTEDAAGVVCKVADDIAVLGPPMLVARYLANHDQRLADSDPLALDDEAHHSLFVSLQSTSREQRAYLRATEYGGEEGPQLHVALSFGDPREAEHFATTLETDVVMTGLVAAPTPPSGPVVEAVEQLATAVESLATRLPEKEVADVYRKILLVRALLKGESSATGGAAGGLLACKVSPCAYSYLAPYLPKPTETEVKGRVVFLEFAGEELKLDALRELFAQVVDESSR
jgi:sec-independent protein translocase protein TatC